MSLITDNASTLVDDLRVVAILRPEHAQEMNALAHELTQRTIAMFGPDATPGDEQRGIDAWLRARNRYNELS